MLKRLVIWLMIFAVFVANFSMAFVYAGFKINQSYIVQTLCVNRFQPSLHCNGNCYLMKKIKQAEDNEKKQSEKDGSVRVEVSFCEEPFRIAFIEPRILVPHTAPAPVYSCFYTGRYKDAIFKPPPLG